ncbi:DJ-1/PfpI family protein [Acinetobacter baumannii]|uniref:DJ-1/PfpI family protein n=1 Tax=Acinetobacter baumannii TaxID=470 RepID=A0AAP1R072_ACIBA|nr:DJ-1/PfpI family protein [Acinetobacter baumannii]MBD2850162.1 DJ-1/PfpI family protein [Acinetobacter baumannii]MBD2852081.1 DJ-1/PfpI family protein [Acinetobacter baumannii]MBD2852808.1 DJ-1/PfpI family protein [Acinetobacter baumannii]MBD3134589.1 DJ-1/PfpI family protein [Acinetobacter baumannii]MBE0307435.1 DJ-1/PfpI family protein [Acinetobacter baumannii]
MRSISIGILLFPKLTQLDLTGPYEVFSRMPNTEVHLIWKTADPIISDKGLTILPTKTFKDCPRLNIICIPGGPGQVDLMNDTETLNFIKVKAEEVDLITSVCTGSLVLGAAGLLNGYKATSHWASIDQLSLLGAIPVSERVVSDRNRITGAGVTSGIDFALKIAADLFDEDIAKSIQLQMEYDPIPPFTSGSQHSASEKTVEFVKNNISAFQQKRMNATINASKKLGLT